jgi:hypothetical protein
MRARVHDHTIGNLAPGLDERAAYASAMAGVAVIVASTLVLVAAAVKVRPHAWAPVADGLVALSAAGVAVGGLMLLDEVATSSWITAPAVLAVAAVLHVRALFAGSGPFRT